jgi:elongation factor 1-beta
MKTDQHTEKKECNEKCPEKKTSHHEVKDHHDKHEAHVAKSLVLLDIRPAEAKEDLDALAKKVISIKKNGLFWKTEYKIEEIGFGVSKLIVGVVVEDEKVSVDDLIENLTKAYPTEIQSVEIMSFDKC